MPKNKILIFGASGMLGSDLSKLLSGEYELLTPTRKECDITSFESLLQYAANHELEAIINAAAYNSVDLAQDEGMEENFLVNAWGAANIARVASIFDIPYISFSTNYVFDGRKEGDYKTTDIPHPINHYGMAKYLGEKMIQREYSDAIIIRTSTLYGGDISVRKHLIGVLYKKIITGELLSIVDDQTILPTLTTDLAVATKHILERKDDYLGSILHLTNSSDAGGISPYNIAWQLLDFMGVKRKIEPTSLEQYVSKAKRPKNSVLENTSDIVLPNWKESLRKYIDSIQ